MIPRILKSWAPFLDSSHWGEAAQGGRLDFPWRNLWEWYIYIFFFPWMVDFYMQISRQIYEQCSHESYSSYIWWRMFVGLHPFGSSSSLKFPFWRLALFVSIQRIWFCWRVLSFFDSKMVVIRVRRMRTVMSGDDVYDHDWRWRRCWWWSL